MKTTGKIRATLIFKGHVQGVGFRASTLHISEAFEVTGTVENLPDGTVRVIAEVDSLPMDKAQYNLNTSWFSLCIVS